MAQINVISKTILHNNLPLSVLSPILIVKTVVTVNDLPTGESV